MKRLRKLTQTCAACPSQWEGEFEDGSPVYVRYRWGYLYVAAEPCGEELFSKQVGGGFDGTMCTLDMLAHTGLVWATGGEDGREGD